MFKEIFLNESKVTIYPNQGTSGSSLCKELSKNESDKAIKSLEKNPSNNLMDFLMSVDPDERYSEPLVIEFEGKLFTLYAANGQLRLGAGGSGFSTCDLVKNVNINSLIKGLSTAIVK